MINQTRPPARPTVRQLVSAASVPRLPPRSSPPQTLSRNNNRVPTTSINKNAARNVIIYIHIYDGNVVIRIRFFFSFRLSIRCTRYTYRVIVVVYVVVVVVVAIILPTTVFDRRFYFYFFFFFALLAVRTPPDNGRSHYL